MKLALAELNTPDEEHPDANLHSDGGWTVCVLETGRVILFDADSAQVAERSGVSHSECLELWLLLQQGKVEEIRTRLTSG